MLSTMPARFLILVVGILSVLCMISFGAGYFFYVYMPQQEQRRISAEDLGSGAPADTAGGDRGTHLVEDKGVDVVKAHCLACHSVSFLSSAFCLSSSRISR